MTPQRESCMIRADSTLADACLGQTFHNSHEQKESPRKPRRSLTAAVGHGGHRRRRSHHGNYSVYGVFDQMIWRSKDDSGRNINIFIRPMFTTLEDRNLINFSADAGLTMHEPIVGRGDDTAGLCVGVARVSSGASGYDKDLEFYEPAVYTPVRGTETFIEGWRPASLTSASQSPVAARPTTRLRTTQPKWRPRVAQAFATAAGFVRVTAGRQRVAQHAHPQATFKPRGRATRPMWQSVSACRLGG